MKELIIAIDSLQKGTSADSKEIKAEDRKGADEETVKMIHEVFNLIIKQDSLNPSSWKKVMVMVIYKKRGPDNIRKLPNAIQAFPTMIYNRRHAKLDSFQFPDQPGFRKKTNNEPRL